MAICMLENKHKSIKNTVKVTELDFHMAKSRSSRFSSGKIQIFKIFIWQNPDLQDFHMAKSRSSRFSYGKIQIFKIFIWQNPDLQDFHMAKSRSSSLPECTAEPVVSETGRSPV